MSETWTVRRVLQWTAGHFDKHEVDAPRLTAELLLAHALSTTRVRLYTDLDRPLEKDELASYRALIARRCEGEPTQYLTGNRDFYGRTFEVDPRVLIPRPETELLVELVLRNLPVGAKARVLDLCTGSGCIGVTLAAERPDLTVVAVDLSPGACELARKNAERHGVGARVTVLEGDLFSPIGHGESFAAVVANPPYVRTDELPTLQREVRREPVTALDGGPDGLSVVRRLVGTGPGSGARAHLAAGGMFALEIAETQGEPVRELLSSAGYAEPTIEQDLARQDRLAFGRQPAAH